VGKIRSMYARANVIGTKKGAKTLRVLLVDDSQELLGTATRLLERDGVDVVGTATSGAEAVRMARDLKPDVTSSTSTLGRRADSMSHAARGRLDGRVARRPDLVSLAGGLVDLVAESPAAGFVSKSRLSAAAIRTILATEPGPAS
jgi:CheY-like chemotaxis protein